MARTRKNEKDTSIVDLAQSVGLTLLNDAKNVEVSDWLPTKIPNLDYILGGGIPFGRVTEIYGKNQSGKCLTKDTLVLTPGGYKTVEDVFEQSGNTTTATKKTVPAEVELINRHGEVEKTSHLTFNGNLPLLSIKTRTGSKQKVTKNHPLLVMSDEGLGVHEWKKAGHLKVGDYVVSRRGDNVFGTDNTLSKHEAYVVGMLVADGSYANTRLSFTNNQENLVEMVEDYFSSLGGEPKKYKKEGSDSYDIHLNNKKIVNEWYAKLGLQPGKAIDKAVPKAILESPEDVQVAFISGYFECESSLGKNHLEVTSASLVLLSQIQVMLKNMGIVTSLKNKKVKAYPDTHYETLQVYGENLLKLVGKLEFTTQQRKGSVDIQKETVPVEGKGSFDIVPNIQSLLKAYYNTTDPALRTRETYTVVNGMSKYKNSVGRKLVTNLLELLPDGNARLKGLLEDAIKPEFFYDRVVSVDNLSEEPTFDFVLPETRSFIAESNINHNSTLAVNLTKNAQEFNIPTIWIDVEGTTTVDTLSSIGVDPTLDNIFIIQPAEGEFLTVEAIREKIKAIAEIFSESYPDMPILIIWDSLAQTPAQTELKDNYNDDRMGVKAKSITSMANQLGQIINKTNIAFIIINQARDDLKANPMFPTIKSTGGRAMEHWASLRLEVQKASQIKEKIVLPTGETKEEYVGHIFRVKTKKSKVSTPNRQAETFLISRPYTGLDFIENVYRQAVDEYKFISKGAWRKYQTESGEEISLRDKEWVPFLQSDEGLSVLTELFLKELKTYFPDDYAPLHNINMDVKGDYFLGIADKMYKGEDISEYTTTGKEEKPKEKKEEPKKEPKKE